MSTTYWSWTFPLAADALTFTQPRFVKTGLPAAISEAMGLDDAVGAHAENDFLHHGLLEIARRFGTTALDDLLMLHPETAEGVSSPVEGFVVAAVLPADIPAAEAELDRWLADPATLADAFGDDVPGDDMAREIADLRAMPVVNQGHQVADESFHLILWFVIRLRHTLARAREDGRAVVHCRYVYL